ncbi:LssY C-terminal domain-containing protein [Candidatus Peregrinibacteria bacterium]|nr:LssY C-terminal domain-containing protein [Candidatus Peregrinibacteria bacterium]
MKRRRYRRWLRHSFRDGCALVMVYAIVAYILLPVIWEHYDYRPSLLEAPKTTENRYGFPGDPLNIALIGSQREVVRSLLLAGWHPADPLSVRTSISIAASILFHRAYPTAPVSNLYLWGRRQDIAFEEPIGKTPSSRHHVRLWESSYAGGDGRPLWIGAATLDRSIGFDRYTGQLTHHIDGDVDGERTSIIKNLIDAKQLTQMYQVSGVGPTITGRNAEGDWYYTDGELTVGVIASENSTDHPPVKILPNPIAIDVKNQGWMWIRDILRQTQLTPGEQKVGRS